MNALEYHTAFRTLSVHCPTNQVHPKSIFLINHRGGDNRPIMVAMSDPKGQRMPTAGNPGPGGIAFGNLTQLDTQKREDQ
jgi:hypothetical protein